MLIYDGIHLRRLARHKFSEWTFLFSKAPGQFSKKNSVVKWLLKGVICSFCKLIGNNFLNVMVYSLCCLVYWAATQDFQQCGICDQQSLKSACAYAQFDQNLCKSLEYSMSDKLLTEHHLEFLSLKGGCTGSSESILVKIPYCWKSHVAPDIYSTSYTARQRIAYFVGESFSVKLENNVENIPIGGCLSGKNCDISTIKIRIQLHCMPMANHWYALYIQTGKRNATIEFCQVINAVHKHELTMTRTLIKALGLFAFIRHVG